MALWFGEARGAEAEGRCSDSDSRCAAALWAGRRLHPQRRSRAGGLRQEEAESAGLGGLQGSGGGHSPLLCLCSLLLFPRSSPTILRSLGRRVDGVAAWAVQVVMGGVVWVDGGGRGWTLVRQWFLLVLAGGVKNL